MVAQLRIKVEVSIEKLGKGGRALLYMTNVAFSQRFTEKG
jgi:hypothetical protein